eukprot:768748-Hanusia_phi.AAC.3
MAEAAMEVLAERAKKAWRGQEARNGSHHNHNSNGSNMNTSLNGINNQVPVIAPQHGVIIEGILHKKIIRSTVSWQQQKVVLSTTDLVFLDLKSDEVLDSIFLHEIEHVLKAVDNDEDLKPNKKPMGSVMMMEIHDDEEMDTDDDSKTFVIKTSLEGHNLGRVYSYRTSSDEEFSSWLKAIKAAVKHAKREHEQKQLIAELGDSKVALFRARVKRLYESNRYQLCLAMCIMFSYSMDIVEAETNPENGSYIEKTLNMIDFVTSTFFCFELAINLFAKSANRFKEFYSDPWNMLVRCLRVHQLVKLSPLGFLCCDLIHAHGRHAARDVFAESPSTDQDLPCPQACAENEVSAKDYCCARTLARRCPSYLTSFLAGVVHPARREQLCPSFPRHVRLRNVGDASLSTSVGGVLWQLLRLALHVTYLLPFPRLSLLQDVRGRHDRRVGLDDHPLAVRPGGSGGQSRRLLLHLLRASGRQCRLVLTNIVVAVLLDEFIAYVSREKEQIESKKEQEREAEWMEKKVTGVLDPLTHSLTHFNDNEDLTNKIKTTFDRLDVDKSGGLTFEEFKTRVRELPTASPVHLNKDDFDIITEQGRRGIWDIVRAREEKQSVPARRGIVRSSIAEECTERK